MIRRVATLIVALLIVLSGPLAAVAQDASPTAGGPGGPAVGTVVSWIGNEGTELAKVAVLEVVDPFQDYDPSSPPERGFHYVLMAVAIENTGTQPLNVDPGAFSLVDTDGFLTRSYGVYRPAEALEASPDLQYGELAPGSSIIGAVGFLVLNGTEIERIVFNPDSDRLLTLVDQRTEGVSLGSTISVLGTEGTEISQVTVNQLIDPFQDYDPSSAPQRGSRFVVIDVTVANTGTRPLQIYANAFYLVDTEGFVATQTFLFRTDSTNPPDFQGGEIAPGASLSGIIAFEVLAGTEIAQVIYSPNTFEQQLIVGEPAAGGSPQPQTTPSTIEPPDEPTAEPTVATAANPEDCAGLQEWFSPTFARLVALQAVLNPIGQALQDPGATPPDPAAIRAAATRLATMAEEQLAATPPPAAEPSMRRSRVPSSGTATPSTTSPMPSMPTMTSH